MIDVSTLGKKELELLVTHHCNVLAQLHEIELNSEYFVCIKTWHHYREVRFRVCVDLRDAVGYMAEVRWEESFHSIVSANRHYGHSALHQCNAFFENVRKGIIK